MTNHQLNIAVLYGGDSAEREVSLRSGAAVAKGLSTAGYEVKLIDTKGFCLSDLAKMDLDLVFIALHGRGGEDGCVQGALEYMGLPYTGSGVLGSALAMDKIKTKQIWRALALPTADFAIVDRQDYQESQAEELLSSLSGKVMVKPANEGSSIGMAIAESAEALNKALAEAFHYDQQILVEAWIDGPEYTVSILGDQALPAIKMETPNQFYDYQAKYQSTETLYHCPSGLSTEQESVMQAIALKAFKATGARGWGRVDMMQNSRGEWQLLEVNTVPGMTETSLVPKAAKVFGLSFVELVTRIVEISREGQH